MRNGQNNKRMRGRNRKPQNPMSRVYESNGPDVKIRGTPSHIAEKYIQLARDSQASGDPVSAENYYQHAEHYLRLIAAAQEQFRQTNPQFYRPEDGGRDDNFDDGEDEFPQPMAAPGEPMFGTRDPQPFLPRDAQPFPQPPAPPPQPQQHAPQVPRPPQAAGQQPSGYEETGNVDRLPSFITGGQQPPQQANAAHQPNQGYSQNGAESQGDRFPLHRRRRRHRSGPRSDMPGTSQPGGGDGGDDAAPSRGGE